MNHAALLALCASVLLTLAYGCSASGRDADETQGRSGGIIAPSTDGFGAFGGSTGAMGGGGLGGGENEIPFDWDLPPGFPTPFEPEDNRTTEAKVRLGRHLFYDERLSRDDSMSCASCHKQELAFTDSRRVPAGATGEVLPRNSMTLANVGYAASLTWAHPLLSELERQALIPMFGETPVELGLRDAAEIEKKLAKDDVYDALFKAAYPEAEERGTLEQMTRALGAFQRTLISGRSPYDRWVQGESNAISPSAQRGYVLFNSEKMECFHCHVGFNLTDHTYWADKPFYDAPFHNTGLYNIDGQGAYPEPNTGVASITGDPSDMGRFKAPTLRNIAITGPYMHDGSIDTLGEVLDHYAHGGRHIKEGAFAGDGSKNPHKSVFLIGFELSEQERADVIAFFESLTDEEFLHNPAYSDPWKE